MGAARLCLNYLLLGPRYADGSRSQLREMIRMKEMTKKAKCENDAKINERRSRCPCSSRNARQGRNVKSRVDWCYGTALYAQ